MLSPEPARIVGVSYASRGLRAHNLSPRKLSREVKILNRTGRCVRHFLAYEAVSMYTDPSVVPCVLSQALRFLPLVSERSLPLLPTCTLIFIFFIF